jgi:demethylmenaquinone methyltransferase/2-methoxy-6-polyprenyl-1,4-benzoquinol methylase
MREPTAPVYYDRRAAEYDDWYRGIGMFAGRERPGFDEELQAITATIAALPPATTLDIACGTGFLTRHLRGPVTGLDASARMLEIAAKAVPAGTFVRGDALDLPFEADSFDRVLTGHFYGHLDADQRTAFLREARRVAPELVVVDASRRHSPVAEEWSKRTLDDGSTWEVFKRYFDPHELLGELGASARGEVLFAGDWFVIVRSPR